MNVIAYIDEAGAKGFSRKLGPGRDDEIGLMSAVLFPADRVDAMREEYRPGFDAFCAAAPAGAKHHFTDAFSPGNEAWAGVADTVRTEFGDIIRRQTPPIVYDARRLAVQRRSHEVTETLKADAEAARRNKRIQLPTRVSARRVETELIEGLTVKLDALAEASDWSLIDLWFDEIDGVLAQHYSDHIDSLRHVSSSTHTVKGWDSEARTPVQAEVRIDIGGPIPLDVTRIGRVTVVGKTDPLVLVADLIANSLHRHLRDLDSQARLNAPDSIEAWPFADRVWGVRDDAIEDVI